MRYRYGEMGRLEEEETSTSCADGVVKGRRG